MVSPSVVELVTQYEKFLSLEHQEKVQQALNAEAQEVAVTAQKDISVLEPFTLKIINALEYQKLSGKAFLYFFVVKALWGWFQASGNSQADSGKATDSAAGVADPRSLAGSYESILELYSRCLAAVQDLPSDTTPATQAEFQRRIEAVKQQVAVAEPVQE